MSNPKYFWNGYVQKCIRRYPNKLDDSTFQGRITKEAIAKAIDELTNEDGGNEKIALVNLVYIANTHTLGGASMVLGISERTATRWSQEFVYKVAKNMGFI